MSDLHKQATTSQQAAELQATGDYLGELLGKYLESQANNILLRQDVQALTAALRGRENTPPDPAVQSELEAKEAALTAACAEANSFRRKFESEERERQNLERTARALREELASLRQQKNSLPDTQMQLRRANEEVTRLKQALAESERQFQAKLNELIQAQNELEQLREAAKNKKQRKQQKKDDTSVPAAAEV